MEISDLISGFALLVSLFAWREAKLQQRAQTREQRAHQRNEIKRILEDMIERSEAAIKGAERMRASSGSEVMKRFNELVEGFIELEKKGIELHRDGLRALNDDYLFKLKDSVALIDLKYAAEAQSLRRDELFESLADAAGKAGRLDKKTKQK